MDYKLIYTWNFMTSANYKDRFAAEYLQLETRISKLEELLKKYKRHELKFELSTPVELLEAQLEVMKAYKGILDIRTAYESIDINSYEQEIIDIISMLSDLYFKNVKDAEENC